MSKTAYFFWYLFLIAFTPLVLSECRIGAVWSDLANFIWLGVGFIAFFILNRFAGKNAEFFRTFSHELNHTVVGLMFFQRIESFQVKSSGEGAVWHERGGNISKVCVSLAPYCLPFFTYVLLVFRVIVRPEFLWVPDLLIGFSTAFYLVCFISQMSPVQTDINQFHYIFSYWYIIVFQVFNLCITFFALLPEQNVFLAFKHFFTSYWQQLQNFFGWLF